MRRAAIVSPIRTGVGKYLGALSGMTAGDLGGVVLRALIDRTGLDAARVDDVIFAQGYPNGEAPCIARWSLLRADFPISVPGYSLDRRCGSGLQAIVDAAMMIQTGAADVVIAGGCESMSNVEYYSTDMRKGARAGSVTLHDRLARGRVMSQPIERFGVISGMIETAENLARDYGISREECDDYAAMSHQRATAAWAQGKFDDEMVPIDLPQKKGRPSSLPRMKGSGPMQRGKALRRCGRSKGVSSLRAMPASKMMRPLPAWWWQKTSWPTWDWSRWPGSIAGPRLGVTRRAWGLVRCPRWNDCSSARGWAGMISIWSS